MIIMNEKIKAAEVELTGVNGEKLGIVPTADALAMARKLKVDLVCTSLFSSPPPCKLIAAGAAKQEQQQNKRPAKELKVKEIRLTPHIEDHDYEVKRSQAERILRSGNAVLLNVAVKGKEGTIAKALLERLLQDLTACGRKKTGIQLSGKQAAVQLDPLV
ncbi:MAG: translation initiation factor [Paenibacillaceae bacterium]|jgi:translation initiation factor IF-3|nr:translation initiation factor [Paenibacillaceae bacterium]